MRILSRYLLKQHAAPFAFALTALTSFMLVNQIAKRFGELVGKGLPWTIIVEFFVLTIPYLVAMTISMSVLVAVLHTFSRLAGDSEITAIRAGGVSVGKLIRPVLAGGALVAVAAFLFGDQVLPRTNHRLRVLMMDIGRTKPTFSLKEHVINEVQRGRVFLRAAQIDQATYRMRDVTIYRLTNQHSTRIVYADSGRIAFAPNQEDLQLTLFNGSVHETDRANPGSFQRTSYETYLITLNGIGSEFIRREGDSYYGDRELGVCDLESVFRNALREEWAAARRAEAAERNGLRALVGLQVLEPDTAAPEARPSLYCRVLATLLPAELEAQQPGTRVQTREPLRENVRARFNAPMSRSSVAGLSPRSRMNEIRIHRDRAHSAKVRAAVYLVEFHKKYAIPAACIVFVLVGVPVALRFPGSGLGMVIGAGLAIFGIYYVGLIAGESLANRLAISPFLAMWTPNIVFGVLGSLALWRVGRQGINSRGGGGRLRRQPPQHAASEA